MMITATKGQNVKTNTVTLVVTRTAEKMKFV